jgi:hypothetical protein
MGIVRFALRFPHTLSARRPDPLSRHNGIHVARQHVAPHSFRRELNRRRRHVGVRRIIDVASPVAAIERRTVVAGQRQVASQPFGQIRIGDEVAAEGDEVGVARRDDCRGTLTRETARRDQCTAEFSPQMLGLRSEPGP